MKRILVRSLLFLSVFGLSGCPGSPEVIKDIRVFVQDNTFYLNKSTADSELVTEEYQRLLNERYDGVFFSPWHAEKPFSTGNEVNSVFERYRTEPGYGENGKKHRKEWVEELAANADLGSYPNGSFRAITVAHTDLRVLPTHEPEYEIGQERGERDLFDRFQQSAVPANTPLYVSHVSKDRSWLYVDSHYASGWIPSADVARVDADLMRRWEQAGQIAITRDGLPIYDKRGRFLFNAELGSQFPSAVVSAGDYEILTAVAVEDGNARVKRAVVPGDGGCVKPLKLTQSNIARMANELLNKPYGWGGMGGNRDCSSMIKDLFAPFGLWLPRHSSDQALEGGVFVDLGAYAPREREKMILKNGIPYFTLIWAKGHIMLYIGEFRGQAMVFHNFWSVRTRDFWGRNGEKIVGRSTITTLHPGADLYDTGPKHDLLGRIKGMTILGLPQEARTLSN